MRRRDGIVGRERPTRLGRRLAGKVVLEPAPIFLRFQGEPAPPPLRVDRVTRSSHDEVVHGLIGKASTARDRYFEVTIALKGSSRPPAPVVFAYDDGVAYRWRFRTSGRFAIADEDGGVGVPDDAQVWAAMADKDGFQSSYETYYREGPPAAAAASARASHLAARETQRWIGVCASKCRACISAMRRAVVCT